MAVEEVFSCRGRVALVTGAASGLGLMFAEVMAEAGADVACADIDEEGLEGAVRAVAARGRKAIAIKCDVAVEAEVKAMVAGTIDRFGTLDILFNNAGTGQVPAPVHELSTGEWDKLIAVDLHGAFYAAREALKVMVPRRYGKIINISSIWGWTGSSALMPCPAYNAAKGALNNLTREMGVCYAPFGINVNGICPGFIKTKIGNNCCDDPDYVRRASALVPMGRIGMPAELRGVALLLASDASSYMCGELIAVDGGYLAR